MHNLKLYYTRSMLTPLMLLLVLSAWLCTTNSAGIIEASRNVAREAAVIEDQLRPLAAN